MSHFIDIASRLKEFHSANGAVCPKCGQSTNMQIFKNYDSAVVFALPIGKFDSNYFALCPLCAGTFILTKEEAMMIKSGDNEVFANLKCLNEAENG